MVSQNIPKRVWPTLIFLSGNILFNSKQDAKGAIILWQRVLVEYPDSPEAHRAAYFIGVIYELTKQPEKARKAYKTLMKDYPDSPFIQLVHEHHLKELDKIEAELKQSKIKRNKGI